MAWGLESGASVTHHRSSDSASDVSVPFDLISGLRPWHLSSAQRVGLLSGSVMQPPTY